MRYSDFATLPREVRLNHCGRDALKRTDPLSTPLSPSFPPLSSTDDFTKHAKRGGSFFLDSARVCRSKRLNLFLKPPKRTRGNTNQRFSRAMNSIATFGFLSSAKLFHFSSNVKRSDFESNRARDIFTALFIKKEEKK